MRAGNGLPLRVVGKFQVPSAGGTGHFYRDRFLQGDDGLAVRTGDLPAKKIGWKFNVPATRGAGDFKKAGVSRGRGQAGCRGNF